MHRHMKTTPEAFLKALAPYRQGLVVAVECLFIWYWLAALWADVLGTDLPLHLPIPVLDRS